MGPQAHQAGGELETHPHQRLTTGAARLQTVEKAGLTRIDAGEAMV